MLTKHLARTSRPLRTLRPSTPLRTFSQQPRHLIKEDKQQSPEELEAKKQQQLKEQKEGKGRWHEDLASAGEVSVKADREEVGDHQKHMKELQEETAGQMEKEHPHGKKQQGLSRRCYGTKFAVGDCEGPAGGQMVMERVLGVQVLIC